MENQYYLLLLTGDREYGETSLPSSGLDRFVLSEYWIKKTHLVRTPSRPRPRGSLTTHTGAQCLANFNTHSQIFQTFQFLPSPGAPEPYKKTPHLHQSPKARFGDLPHCLKKLGSNSASLPVQKWEVRSLLQIIMFCLQATKFCYQQLILVKPQC